MDVHHYGRPRGRSVEADIPVGLHERTVASDGGAGLVARNLRALGVEHVYASPWPAVTKERFIVGGAKVLRWNRDAQPLAHKRGELIRALKRLMPRAAVLVISDYRHGLISRALARQMLALARKAGVPVYVDSQVAGSEANHAWYRGADLVLVNQAEAKALHKEFDEKHLEPSLRRLQKKLGVSNIVAKLGAEGCAALMRGEYARVPGVRVRTKDAVGAGDAFLAALAGQTLSRDALLFANRWAALATTIEGTEPPKRSMLRGRI